MAQTNNPVYEVSVSIITYNQADCIRKAVDSALTQEVNFPFEIIIGDDCSTDGTREILLDYKQKYPDLIKLNLHDEHYEGIPGRPNNITNIRSAEGKYVAFCDGDDYWVSRDKLQKQVDFMNAHPEFSFSFHDVWYIYEGVKEKKFSDQFYHLRQARAFSIHDLVRKIIQIPSGSVFMRTKYINPDYTPRKLDVWFKAAGCIIRCVVVDYRSLNYLSSLAYAKIRRAFC